MEIKSKKKARKLVLTCGMVGLLAIGLIGCGKKQSIETSAPVETVMIETTTAEETTEDALKVDGDTYVVKELTPEEESIQESEADEIEMYTDINIVTGEPIILDKTTPTETYALPKSVEEATEQLNAANADLMESLKDAYVNGCLDWDSIEATIDTVSMDDSLKAQYKAEIKAAKKVEETAAPVQETQVAQETVKETAAPVQETQVAQETAAPVQETQVAVQETEVSKSQLEADLGEFAKYYSTSEENEKDHITGKFIPGGEVRDDEWGIFH